MYIIPDKIIEIARNLRKNMTNAEKLIWNEIKNNNLGVKFLRQKPIYVYTENDGLNRFIIADFYNNEKKLIIEVDGSIHNNREIIELDKEKERLLKNLGYKILRIQNKKIYQDINTTKTKIKNFLYPLP